MRRHELLFALNAGGVDIEATARVDLERMRLAGEHPVAELLPRVLGPATLRPGSQTLAGLGAQTRQLSFDNEDGDRYVLLLSDAEMRIGNPDDGSIAQVPAVATRLSAIWIDASAPGAAISMPGGPVGLLLGLTSHRSFLLATTTATARMRQPVSVALADLSTTHVLRVVVLRGPVFLRVGTTAGGTDRINDAMLATGTHKIGFVPGVSVVYVEIWSDDPVDRIVGTVQMESAHLTGGTGDLVLPTPWGVAALERLRSWQSIDTVFAGDGSGQQRLIEHRGPLSWGVAIYQTDDGPWSSGLSRISLTPAALTGNTTVTASEAYFRSGHVGALLEMTQTGKTATQVLSGVGQVSDHVTIIGVDAGRYFHRTGASSAFIGTVVLERSFDADTPVAWTTFETYVNGAVAFARTQVDDTLDNLTVHYRFRVSAYTSGSATMTLEYESGIQVGRARITTVQSSTVVDVESIRAFGNTGATRSWRIGAWSDVAGWPRTPRIEDDRLHWWREDQHFASEVSDYYGFDDADVSDASPFTRSVGGTVLWAASPGRLVVGTPRSAQVIAASELDEPLSPTRWTARPVARVAGAADIDAAEYGGGAFFARRAARRIYEMSIPSGSTRPTATDVSFLNPGAWRSGIVRLAVQQQPETRLLAVMESGSLVVLTWEPDEKVVATTTINIAGGLVEDVVVLADDEQDDVYLIVNRSGQRFWERLAPEMEQTDPATCALLDGHKVLTGSVTAISGGVQHAGQTVQVWADGRRRSDVTLSAAGAAALGATYSRVVYGRAYTARFRSVKLAYAAGLGTALGQTKIVHGAALILANACLDGVMVGGDASMLGPLPAIVNGAARTPNQHFAHYDADVFPIQSDWTSDARFHVEINSAEGPCTVQAIVLDVETRDGAAAPGNR